MECSFVIFDEEKGFYNYSCHEVRELQEKWKEEWKKKNRTEDMIIAMEGIDRDYEDFCQAIYDFLSQCRCDCK